MKALSPIYKTWGIGILTLMLLSPLALTFQGCTDLDEEVFGSVTADQFYRTEAEFLAALAPVYAQLRAMMWNYHNLSEHSSDEVLVPTRGGDWGDGGTWRSMHQHTWTPALPDINGAWTDAYTGIARANTVLANLESSTAAIAAKDIFKAELRTLRAFYYYQLMDFFGGVPIVTDPALDPKNPPARNTRAEVFAFIEQELNESLSDLQARSGLDAGSYGRVTKGAARALLARMYLNAEVFTGTARWQDASTAADGLLNSGEYSLAGDYFDNFRLNNQNSPELIFVVAFLPKGGLGFNFHMRVLHYNQRPANAETPWNGFTTLADFYSKWDATDKRKKIFLVGQQYAEPISGCLGNECWSQGAPLTDRQGNPLIFTPEINNIENANEREGVRILKWEIDPNQVGGDAGNDYAFLRLAEIYLTKAEALNELGQTAAAVDLVNVLRARAYDPPAPLSAGAFTQASFRDQLLLERGHELTNEAVRRSDLIRYEIRTGTPKFTAAWQFKEGGSPGGQIRMLFPIPQAQLDANPSLTQNPGY